MKKAILVLAICAVLVFACVSCRHDPKTKTVVKCNVTFHLNVDGYTNANIRTYVIQIRCIPLFGDYSTPGRNDNWKTVEDSDGTFIMQGLQEGNWTFYIRVVDSGEILQEIFTGTKAVYQGVVIDLGESPVYSGYGKIGMYIRADRIAEAQYLKVTAENISTAVKYDFTGMEWSAVEKGTSYVDYAYITDEMPVGNYVFHVSVGADEVDEALAMEDMVAVKPTEDALLVMRLRAERFEDADLVIDGQFRNLEGVLSGPVDAVVGVKQTFRYVPLNSYTQENAVWYWWWCDGRRYSSRLPEFTYAFEAPGQYIVSCVPVGINGEIPKDGSSLLRVTVGIAEEN